VSEGRNNSSAETLATTVSAIAGALTAVAGLVIVPGSIALLWRFDQQDLPPDLGTVTSLPSQFLLGVGVGYILMPLLLLAGLSIVILAAPEGRWKWPVLGVVAAALAVGIPLTIDPSPPPPAEVFVISVAWSALWWLANRWIARRAGPFSSLSSRLNRRSVSLTALAAIASFLPWTVAFAALRGEFPQATVCLTDGDRFDGVLIGETGTKVYMGDPDIQVVAFVPVEMYEPVASVLHNLGYEVVFESFDEAVDEPGSEAFIRADAILINLAKKKTSELKEVYGKANAPALGFDEAKNGLAKSEKRANEARIDLVRPRSRVDNNPAVVENLFENNDDERRGPQRFEELKTERRITSIPQSRVTQIYVGGSAGICPKRLRGQREAS
jgi:hypothetical protein